MGRPAKEYNRALTILKISSYEVENIVEVLARARLHLSHGRPSLTAELIKHAENKLVALGKEADNHESSNLR